MKKYLYTSLFFIFFLVGCEKYLDIVPREDIETIETQFEKKEDAFDWLQTCYSFMEFDAARTLGNTPNYLGADEFCYGDYIKVNQRINLVKIGEGLQMGSSPIANVWHQNHYFAALRYCNIFLENIGDVYNMTQKEKELWAAEVKAVKAFYYFDMLRRYGPLVLIETNSDANVSLEDMRQTRRPIDECVEVIVKLCDEAMEILPVGKDKELDHQLFFNREATATLKALTLLYAASPLFNGNTLMADFKNRKGERLFPEYDHEKWKRAGEAIDEAILICTKEANRGLVKGYSDRPTALLNTIQDIENTWNCSYDNQESILTINNTSELLAYYIIGKAPSSARKYYAYEAKGGLSASMKMVEMFYTANGLPLEEDKFWAPSAFKYNLTKERDERYKDVLPLNEEVLGLHCQREPRFYAMITGDRMLWYRAVSTGGNVKYEALPMQMRQGEVLGSPSKRYTEDVGQYLTGYMVRKWLNTDVPLYNYHRNAQSYGVNVRYVFRLAELYLAGAEAWNEYAGPAEEKIYTYLDEVRTRAGIQKVRDAWKNAKNPGKVNTKEGMREIIQREWNIEFAFEGRRYYNLRRWMVASEELNSPMYGWNILASDSRGFYCNYEKPMIVQRNRRFSSPRDYFTPIRSEEILISGLVQNPGW